MESEHSSKQVASISFLHLLLLKDCKLFQFGEGKKKYSILWPVEKRQPNIYCLWKRN